MNSDWWSWFICGQYPFWVKERMEGFGFPHLWSWELLSFNNRSINVLVLHLKALWSLRADPRCHDSFHKRRVAFTVHCTVRTVLFGICQAMTGRKVAHWEGGALKDDDASRGKNTAKSKHSRNCGKKNMRRGLCYVYNNTKLKKFRGSSGWNTSLAFDSFSTCPNMFQRNSTEKSASFFDWYSLLHIIHAYWEL